MERPKVFLAHNCLIVSTLPFAPHPQISYFSHKQKTLYGAGLVFSLIQFTGWPESASRSSWSCPSKTGSTRLTIILKSCHIESDEKQDFLPRNHLHKVKDICSQKDCIIFFHVTIKTKIGHLTWPDSTMSRPQQSGNFNSNIAWQPRLLVVGELTRQCHIAIISVPTYFSSHPMFVTPLSSAYFAPCCCHCSLARYCRSPLPLLWNPSLSINS